MSTPSTAPIATSEAPTTPPPAAAAPSTAPAPAASGDHWTSGLSDETKVYVSQKGFKDVSAVVDSYRNFEKLQGVPAENLLKLPKDASDTEGWNNVFNKLGRPSKPEEYNIPMPEKGGDENFAKFARGLFHESGLTKSQGEKVVGKWNEYAAGMMKQNHEAQVTRLAGEEKTLRSEWGADWEKNVKIGENASKTFGLTDEQLVGIESVVGFSATMKLFHNIGSKLGEDKFVTGGGGKPLGSNRNSAQALARIAELKADTDFTKRYLNGGSAEKAEMDKLHAEAYPDIA